MKELSIEERAKRYDKLFVKASRIYNKENDVLILHTIEDLFPELKESEDERIKEALIEYFRWNVQQILSDFDNKEVLAWLENIPYTIDHEKREGFHLGYKAVLEKQGESYTKKDVDDAYVEGMAFAKNELEKQGEPSIKWNKNTEGNKPQVNHSVLMKTTHSIAEGEWKGEYWEQYRWAGIVRDSDVLSWMELSSLEKQGEQKPTLRERYKNIAESEWFKKTHEGMSVSDDEKVDNVNKIEPKFKVGDWITDGEAVFHITSYDIDYGYQLETPKGILFHSSDENVENKYHLWSIQNAKDGDVLAEDTCVFIIKKLNHDLTAEIYCCLYDDGDFELNSNLGFDDTCTYPATKEQRDILFQKMEEAGYSWDDEKKELKKIEQNPAWSEEDEEVRQYIVRIMKQRDINVPMVQKALTWLEKQGEQKPRYSIGDVLCDKSCTTLNKEYQPNFEITDIRNGMYICDKCSFPISQQDEYELVAKRIEQEDTWNKEDERILDALIVSLNNERFAGRLETLKGIGVPLVIDWLKSLRQRMGE